MDTNHIYRGRAQRRIFRWGLVFASLLALPVAATAQDPGYHIIAGKLIYVENGWGGEGIALKLTANFAGSTCTAPKNEFFIATTSPSYKDMVALALSAFHAGTDVELVVQLNACTLTRPRLYAIRLVKG